MSKFLLTLVTILSALGFHTRASAEEVPKLQVVTSSPTSGISEFSAADPLELTEVFSDTEGNIAKGAAMAFDGQYLYMYKADISYGTAKSLAFCTYQLEGGAWKFVKSVEMDKSIWADYPIKTMAYDPKTGNLYGIVEAFTSVLFSIDKETGAMTKVKNLTNRYNMIMFDQEGQAYASNVDGELFKLDIENNGEERVGVMGATCNAPYNTVIDPATKRVFAFMKKGTDYALYEIDLATAATTKIADFATGTTVLCLLPTYGSQTGGGGTGGDGGGGGDTPTSPKLQAVTTSPTAGISDLYAEDPLTLTEVFSDAEGSFAMASSIGFDGKNLYTYKVDAPYGSARSLYFCTYQLEDGAWKFVKSVEMDKSLWNDYPIQTMAYDAKTGTLYGLVQSFKTYLMTIDTETGVMSPVKMLPNRYNMLMFDQDGQAYASTVDGELFKLDISANTEELVGVMGATCNSPYNTVTDPASKRVFAFMKKSNLFSLYEIDMATAKATKIGDFAEGTQIIGLLPTYGSQTGGGGDEAPAKWFGITSSPTAGISSFEPKEQIELTEVFSDAENDNFVAESKTCFDPKTGSLYVYRVKHDQNYMLTSLRFATYKLDGDSWSLAGTNNGLSVAEQSYPQFMALDPQTQNLYGFRNNDLQGTDVYLVDKATGAMEQKLKLDRRVNMVAFDKYGQAYASNTSGEFFKVGLEDGATTKLGDMGMSTPNVYTGFSDPQTGKLYVDFVPQNNRYALYEVNTSTGAPTKVGDFPEGAVVNGIAFVPGSSQQAGDTQAPDVCTALSVEYATLGGKEATLKATAPTLAFDKQTTLTGNVDLVFYVDDAAEPAGTATGIAPGEEGSVSYTFETEGKHTVKVVASNSIGVAPPKTVPTFVGIDTPAAPTEVSLSISQDGNYTLTWTAPEKGVNNGDIDKDNMKFAITQYPGGKLVADDVAGSPFTGVIANKALANYWFGVKAVCGDKASEEALSNKQTCGDAVDLPFYDDFTDQSTHDFYTIINPEGTYGWEFKLNTTGFTTPYYDGTNNPDKADEWLMLPPMNIVEGVDYTFSFKAYAGFGQETGNTIKLALTDGSYPSTEYTELATFTDITDDRGQESKSVSFKATKSMLGTFAIICKSDAGHTMTLCNVNVTATGFPEGPENVSALKAEAAAEGKLAAHISFTAPTKDKAGNPLTSIRSIRLYRDGEPKAVATVESPEPGKAYTMTDESMATGNHIYNVVVIGDKGCSDGSKIPLYVGEDLPSAPTNMAVSVDGDDFLITWDTPTSAINGGYIDYANLKYALYFIYGPMESPETYSTTLTGNEVRVPRSVFDGYASAHQILITFMLQGVSGGGGGALASKNIIYGLEYKLPFSESFANGSATTEPWGIKAVEGSYVNSWTMVKVGQGTLPMAVSPYDGDKGMAMFYPITDAESYSARLLGPQITLTGNDNPTLIFHMYHYTPTLDNETDGIQVEVQKEGEETFEAVGDRIIVSGDEGWQEHKVSLKDVGADKVRIVFRATSSKSVPLFIDAITVKNEIATGLTAVNGGERGAFATDGGIVVSSADYRIYGTSGNLVAQGKAVGGKKIALTPGIYVAVVNGKTVKCVVK